MTDSPIVGRNMGNMGKGRPKGSRNRTTAILKDAILKAAENAGKGDMVAYLTQQAINNPGPFMSLLGKVLPMQIAGDPNAPLNVITRIELVAPSGNSET
ncbi:hypothetical protein [Allorhizobium borbori]|uniref:Uncharacterized protein n=1 Tax=Allorhizobium borbori TaxID=485907 RepID=A0A7W6P0S0_9HYPH|nr:hypothetical protein [Allorhizobium borbori]MBB4103564.1 hypothetical protein [Allorhizobium borbori]